MVRLKDYRVLLKIKEVKFQFHYGTIKRKTSRSAFNQFTSFQFHYGTIKSRTRCLLLLPIINFNSTMVRLKVSWWSQY